MDTSGTYVVLPNALEDTPTEDSGGLEDKADELLALGRDIERDEAVAMLTRSVSEGET